MSACVKKTRYQAVEVCEAEPVAPMPALLRLSGALPSTGSIPLNRRPISKQGVFSLQIPELTASLQEAVISAEKETTSYSLRTPIPSSPASATPPSTPVFDVAVTHPAQLAVLPALSLPETSHTSAVDSPSKATVKSLASPKAALPTPELETRKPEENKQTLRNRETSFLQLVPEPDRKHPELVPILTSSPTLSPATKLPPTAPYTNVKALSSKPAPLENPVIRAEELPKFLLKRRTARIEQMRADAAFTASKEVLVRRLRAREKERRADEALIAQNMALLTANEENRINFGRATLNRELTEAERLTSQLRSRYPELAAYYVEQLLDPEAAFP